jgi:hypothetical protein
MQTESPSGFIEFLGIVARVVPNIEKRDVVRFLIIVAADIKKSMHEYTGFASGGVNFVAQRHLHWEA